jgi:RHS repeat-associated protein
LASPNGLETLTLLNTKGLPESIAVASGPGARPLAFAYEYDEEDRVRACRDSITGARRYRYDAEAQLLGVDASDPQWGEHFEYDPAGNLISMSSAGLRVNELNQLTSDGSGTYEYDQRGNVVATQGTRSDWRFTYDARNLMVRAESSTGAVAIYEYDAFRRRVIKRTGDATVTYVWAGDQLVSEVWQSGDRSAHRDYAYYPGTPTPLATRIGASVYCYHTDRLGAPFAMSGPDGSLVWTAAYRAFGEARPSVTQVRNPLRAPGQYFDEETGLHYNRFRYYSPAIGRYLSRDPVSYLAGLNLYQYSSNNPVNCADPLGLWSWKSVASIAAAVVVGIVVVAALANPIGLAAAIILGGAAAGAVGFGLNEALNEKTFSPWCIFKEAVRGAVIGALAAIPFALLPVTAGVAAFMGAGAESGAISYIGNWATSNTPWSWGDFALSIGIGAVTAGAGRFIAGRIAAWRAGAPAELDYEPSSGAVLEAEPGKTTTILGRFDPDMKPIVEELGNVKSLDFGPKEGDFNVLNVPDDLYETPNQFWNDYNKPWLDQAIARGDNFVLATEPTPSALTQLDGTPTGFGREFNYLLDNGYTYDPATQTMSKP